MTALSVRSRNKRVPILMYHSIGSYEALNRLERIFTVTPRAFEKHMELLRKKGYTALSFSDLDGLLAQDAPFEKKYVMITFDDGFGDNHEFAFPILRKYGMKGVFFIATGLVGAWNTWDLRKGFKKKKLLTWDQIADMKKAGMEFQAHSRVHRDLTRLKPADIKREVEHCVEALRATLAGEKVLAFSYPFGRYNEDVMDVLKESKIKYGVTVRPGTAHFGRHDNLFLPRMLVRGDQGLCDFYFRLTAGFSPSLLSGL